MTQFQKITDKVELEEGAVLAPRFDANGLITAVVQDAEKHDILMLAHMNAEALEKTLETGQSHFWSRSRKEIWHKGATSGEYQNVVDILIDCDQDAVVLRVNMVGESACHTGRRSCFYRNIKGEDAPTLNFVDG